MRDRLVDEFRGTGSSVPGERTGHPMNISLGRQRYINEWPWHDTYGASDGHAHHH
jgi:hypothetical protein